MKTILSAEPPFYKKLMNGISQYLPVNSKESVGYIPSFSYDVR